MLREEYKLTLLKEIKFFITQPRVYFNKIKNQDRLCYASALCLFLVFAKTAFKLVISDEQQMLSREGTALTLFGLLIVFSAPQLLFLAVANGILHKTAQFIGGKGTFKSYITCTLLIYSNLLIIFLPFYAIAALLHGAVYLIFFIGIIHAFCSVILWGIALQACYALSLRQAAAIFAFFFLIGSVIYGSAILHFL